jgi:exodeoxyribonuclease V beta subunit
MLTDFKPGALAGECIHKFLELFDLSLIKDDPARAETEGLALARRMRRGLRLAGTPGSAANELLSKRLPRQLLDFGRALAYLELDGVDSTFTLASLPKASSARELEFDFAVRRPLREGDLNALLHEHGFEGARKRLGREFENLVASLPLDAATASVPCYIKMRDFTRRSGVMNGKADFVFEAGGRYHLIDWKATTWAFAGGLRARPPAGGSRRARLRPPIPHLRAGAALHLSRTLEGYEFERHFGNILYVYARGAGAGGGLGVTSTGPRAP